LNQARVFVCVSQQIESFEPSKLAHNHSLVKTEYFGRQGASSCNGKRPNVVNLVGRCCCPVDLHSTVTVMGFHAVKLWQNETFHCHNQMNIIILIHEWERRKQIVTSSFSSRGANYLLASEMNFCV
jgi:hypothetical protein